MAEQPAPTRLLRVAAALVDALALALLLIAPATIISYAAAWFGGSIKAVSTVWWGAFLILCVGILIRDGLGGRSPGKRLFGLRLTTRDGRRCSIVRSVLRNFPLVIPGWNLLEVVMVLVLRPPRRTGDLVARTSVTEE